MFYLKNKVSESKESDMNYFSLFGFFENYLKTAKEIFSSIALSKLFKEFRFAFFLNIIFDAFLIKISQQQIIFFRRLTNGLEKFIIFSENRYVISRLLAFYLVSFLLSLFSNLIGNRIQNDSFYFVKKITIKKLFNLKIEDKVSKKPDVSVINDEESWEVAEKWNHIPNHFVSSIVKILSLFTSSEIRNAVYRVGKRETFISFSFIFFIGFLDIHFANKNDKRREDLRISLKDEAYLTEKEVSKSILIDNMGLKNKYFAARESVVEHLNDKFFGLLKSEIFFNKTIEFLTNIFPFVLLIFFNSSLLGYFFFAFSETLSAVLHLIECYRESKSLVFSLKTIDKFLLLPERNENKLGLSLSKEEVKSISFCDVCFAYEDSEEEVISNYNVSFVKSKLNRIEGKNGTGKSTILYLTLGAAEPQKGEVLVNLQNGKSFNVTKEVNLVDWKENVVAYVSHENLFEQDKGSTGQKQIMNIDQVISEKKSAQIFLFDEADNSLDENNRLVFYKKVEWLISNNKIVILISH